MVLNNKKVAVFVAGDYEDLEAWYPILRLKEAGTSVTVIASDNVEGMSCESKHVFRYMVSYIYKVLRNLKRNHSKKFILKSL